MLQNNKFSIFYKNNIPNINFFNINFFFYFYNFFLNSKNIYIFKKNFYLFLNFFFQKIKINNRNFFYFNFNKVLYKNYYKFNRFPHPYKYLYYSLRKKPKLIDIYYCKYWRFINDDETIFQNWSKSKRYFFFIENFFYFYRFFFLILKFNYIYLNTVYNSSYLKSIFTNFNNIFIKKFNWLLILIKFKNFIKINYYTKIKFYRFFSFIFWNFKLYYWFDRYLILKSEFIIFPLFFFFKLNSFFFYYLIISLFFSKFFWLFNYFKFKFKPYNDIYNKFIDNIIFIQNYYKENYNFLIFLFIFKWSINCINWKVSLRKLSFNLYGSYQHFHKLCDYFKDLLIYTTKIDSWLKRNNLISSKLELLFIKILLFFDFKFHLKRRPWHSFYNRFFDIGKFLFFKCKKIISTNLGKQFFRFFSKFLLFIKYNKYSFRNKLLPNNPIRFGNKLRS